MGTSHIFNRSFSAESKLWGFATPSAFSILVSDWSRDFVHWIWGFPVSIAALCGGSIEVINFDQFNSVLSRSGRAPLGLFELICRMSTD